MMSRQPAIFWAGSLDVVQAVQVASFFGEEAFFEAANADEYVTAISRQAAILAKRIRPILLPSPNLEHGCRVRLKL